MKKGFFVNIYINIQPIAHISTAEVYCFLPNKTYGALYHNVYI